MSQPPIGFYDVGKGRGSGFGTVERVEARGESAVVLDHDSKMLEIWWRGESRGGYMPMSRGPCLP